MTWSQTLHAAGVHDRALRADYTRQRRAVARFKPAAYLAVRLLLPARLVPHVIAATAFMHRTDDLLDSGPLGSRRAAFERWREEVLTALAEGAGALGHSAALHPRLAVHVKEFLATATTDLDFSGFPDESAYQRYVDDYSLPALMVVAGLLSPEPEPAAREFRSACRHYIDGSQRLDFVNDLADDLREAGRLTLPQDALDRHGVTRADLEAGRSSEGVTALLREQLAAADSSLTEGQSAVPLAPPHARPLLHALLSLDRLTLRSATADLPRLLRASARPPTTAAIGVLLRARRQRMSPSPNSNWRRSYPPAPPPPNG